MAWDGIAIHKQYAAEIGLTGRIEAYIQSRALNKTLESISFDYRQGIDEQNDRDEMIERAMVVEEERKFIYI